MLAALGEMGEQIHKLDTDSQHPPHSLPVTKEVRVIEEDHSLAQLVKAELPRAKFWPNIRKILLNSILIATVIFGILTLGSCSLESFWGFHKTHTILVKNDWSRR